MIKYFLAPLITAIIITLINVYFIEKYRIKETEIWKTKYTSYLEAIQIVSDIYSRQEWGKEFNLNESNISKIDSCLSKLHLLCEDKNIPNKFIDCVNSRVIKTDMYADLINSIRQDLGRKNINFNKDDTLFLSLKPLKR